MVVARSLSLMHSVPHILRLAIVLGMLIGPPAQALSWKGIEPGTSTRADVVAAFGAPSRTVESGGTDILAYLGAQALEGARQAHFRIDRATSVVQRVDIFPAPTLPLNRLDTLYGPPCGAGGPSQQPCYQPAPKKAHQYVYPQTGLLVHMEPDGQTVKVLTLRSLPRPAPLPSPAPPTDEGQAQAEIPQGQWPEGLSQQEAEPETLQEESLLQPRADPPAGTPRTTEGVRTPEDAGFLSSLNDALTLGGTLYARFEGNGVMGENNQVACCQPRSLQLEPLSVFLLDVYLDGRPSDRVRGMAVLRTHYAPLNPSSQLVSQRRILERTGSSPALALDQLWVRFDLWRLVYFTAGRHHLRWGASRLWNPANLLATAVRDPLARFDERLGADLFRLHVPFEDLKANLHAIGFGDTQGDPLRRLRLGAAFRGEILLLSTLEVGAAAVFQDQVRPRYAADFSMGLGPVDVYGEVALLLESERKLWRFARHPRPADGYAGQFEPYRPRGYIPNVSGGFEAPVKLNERHSLFVGLEGFYQLLGYSDPAYLPWLVLQNEFTPLYLSKFYGGLRAGWTDADPFLSKSVTLTAIANIDQRAVLPRLDLQLGIGQNLKVELYLEAPIGPQGSEFRPVFYLPEERLSPESHRPAVDTPLPVVRGGLGLRLHM
jgi:hypothetical protein